jgi:hypothetical protein
LVDFGAMVARLLPRLMRAVYIWQVCCLNKLDVGSLDKVHRRSWLALSTSHDFPQLLLMSPDKANLLIVTYVEIFLLFTTFVCFFLLPPPSSDVALAALYLST